MSYLDENDKYTPIRKIVFGDPVKGMAIVVGQEMAGCTVVSIERSSTVHNNFFIYAKDASNVIRLWKEVINQPTFVEFDLRAKGY
jgi:hypothetical protein